MRNARAKARRIKQNYNIDVDIELPKIESFSTRKEYNRWKEKTQDFTNRYNRDYQYVKNRYGVVASKSEIRQAEHLTAVAQRRARDVIERAQTKPFIQGGKDTGQTVGQRMQVMGKPNAGGVNVPADFNFNNINTRRRFEERLDKTKNMADKGYYEERNKTMRDNFINILELSFNSDADELVERLKNVNPDDFYEIYLMFEEFDFSLYDSEGVVDMEEGLNHVRQMMSYLDRYDEGKLNFDLKGF